MALAYLGFGGNVGDVRETFRLAGEKLATLGALRARSSLYETEPVGFADQPRFLNMAVSLDTALPPGALLGALKGIETGLGRTPGAKNGPREIDIDILLYDDATVGTDTLSVPHPRLHERGFALVPLAEIAPDVVHPVFQKTVRELLDALSGTQGIEKVGTLDG
jgi:2-amino-4-hydroxy-6-hydroxymethyldihydropteridine diphosphokinase